MSKEVATHSRVNRRKSTFLAWSEMVPQRCPCCPTSVLKRQRILVLCICVPCERADAREASRRGQRSDGNFDSGIDVRHVGTPPQARSKRLGPCAPIAGCDDEAGEHSIRFIIAEITLIDPVVAIDAKRKSREQILKHLSPKLQCYFVHMRCYSGVSSTDRLSRREKVNLNVCDQWIIVPFHWGARRHNSARTVKEAAGACRLNPG